jgi:hypothetical protein
MDDFQILNEFKNRTEKENRNEKKTVLGRPRELGGCAVGAPHGLGRCISAPV